MLKQENNSLPKSLQEARKLGSNKYYTGKLCKHGHDSYRYTADRVCAVCVKLKVKKAATFGKGNARRWANKTQEQLVAIYKKRKDYYMDTREHRLLERKKSYLKLSQDLSWMEKRRETINNYRKNSAIGKASHLANTIKRRASKLQRTPKWANLKAITSFYEMAKELETVFPWKQHVDHIVPLQGKLVSGLHVENNLQIIPWFENVSKANRFVPV